MAQGAAGCNRLTSETDGVLDHLDATRTVDTGQIKTHFGQRSGWLVRQKFRGRGLQAQSLPGSKHRRSFGKAARGLDLDKDHTRAFAQDQVDFAAFPAPAARGHRGARPLVAAGDLVLGGKPRVIGDRAP